MKRNYQILALCLGITLSLWGCARQISEEGRSAGQAAPAVSSAETATLAQPEAPQPAEPELALETDASYPLSSEQISYTLIVPEGQKAQVVLAPQLERQTEAQDWQPVPCAGGFCGNPDALEGRYEDALLAEWYPDLCAGNYRLSFQAWMGEDSWPDGPSQTISAQFQLTDKE